MTKPALKHTATIQTKTITPRTDPVSQCVLCNSTKTSFFFESQDYNWGVQGKFSYKRCNDCGTVFQSPMVIEQDISLCYPENYDTHYSYNLLSKAQGPTVLATAFEASTATTLNEKFRYAVIKAVCGEPPKGLIGLTGRLLALSRKIRERAFFSLAIDELLPREFPAGRALEVGCGKGHVLVALKQMGWEVEGVELSQSTADIAHQRTNAKILVGDFSHLQLPPASYRLIVSYHSLEHFISPLDTLRRMTNLLIEGGKLVIVCPNPASLGAKLHKEFWTYWDTPRHLSLLPPQAYIKAAQMAGLEVVSIRTTSSCLGWDHAKSRSFREGKVFDMNSPNVTLKDKRLYWLQRLASNFGIKLGEEVIVVMSKPDA
jgi:SAM-dependent methyltransferase